MISNFNKGGYGLTLEKFVIKLKYSVKIVFNSKFLSESDMDFELCN